MLWRRCGVLRFDMTALSFVSKDNEGNQNLFFGFGQGFGMGRRNFYRTLVTSAFEPGV